MPDQLSDGQQRILTFIPFSMGDVAHWQVFVHTHKDISCLVEGSSKVLVDVWETP